MLYFMCFDSGEPGGLSMMKGEGELCLKKGGRGERSECDSLPK